MGVRTHGRVHVLHFVTATGGVRLQRQGPSNRRSAVICPGGWGSQLTPRIRPRLPWGGPGMQSPRSEPC